MRAFLAALFLCVASPAFAFSQYHVPGALLSKVAEIKAVCGSKVVSGHRPGSRTPSGHISEHALGRAVDMQGNPSCIYRLLRNWPGGYSTDYASAPGGPHVHISYGPGGREWGQRFAHSGKSYISARKKKRSKRRR